MNEALWLIAATFNAILGMAWLALSLKNHWEQAHLTGNPHTLRLRIAGAGCLMLSLMFCLVADHPSMAALVWVMLLPLSASLVAMTLSGYAYLLRLVCPKVFVSL